ncbi:OsmC family protein [Rarobacter incanus]|uniref:Putative OsmC-like protein n=1 Tax=Rarobacter incanus TaxID=153494 RepID=A0A542SP32_9MICO|nr:OsmC family protein [Rarobacter incanus]TQK76315.1 putative OsmC-like protein [Rarobacter incanus]
MTQTDPSAFPPVTVSRLAHRRFVGRSSRGGEVAIGDASFPDTFTPGELLKVALAACAGFTAESAVTRRLGDDAAMTIEVGGDKDPAQDRYPRFAERIELDLSSLDPVARERLITVVTRSIEQACTVARTVKAGATIDMRVVDPRD